VKESGGIMSVNTNQEIKIKRVTTEAEASKVALLYISYYKRVPLTNEEFLKRWKFANSHENYYMLAAYLGTVTDPVGFIDFAIVPSIFGAPSLARIDSTHIKDQPREKEILDALFDQALSIMKQHEVSKVIAVSCSNYEQEVRLLTNKLAVDDNPMKTFFFKAVS
jgi:hypothetical protein